MNIYMRDKGLITGDIRNGGNVELSEQSSCLFRQGTKVDSTEECDQVTSTPHKVRQDSNIPQRSIDIHQQASPTVLI